MKKRSGEAQAAQHRKAGPMKHRLAPRGGANNDDSEQELCSECGRMIPGIADWCLCVSNADNGIPDPVYDAFQMKRFPSE